jgi:hypothetical protein
MFKIRLLSLFINILIAYAISTVLCFVVISVLMNIGVDLVIASVVAFLISYFSYFSVAETIARTSDAIAGFAYDKYKKVSSFFSNLKEDMSMNSFNKKNGLIKLN